MREQEFREQIFNCIQPEVSKSNETENLLFVRLWSSSQKAEIFFKVETDLLVLLTMTKKRWNVHSAASMWSMNIIKVKATKLWIIFCRWKFICSDDLFVEYTLLNKIDVKEKNRNLLHKEKLHWPTLSKDPSTLWKVSRMFWNVNHQNSAKLMFTRHETVLFNCVGFIKTVFWPQVLG